MGKIRPHRPYKPNRYAVCPPSPQDLLYAAQVLDDSTAPGAHRLVRVADFLHAIAQGGCISPLSAEFADHEKV